MARIRSRASGGVLVVMPASGSAASAADADIGPPSATSRSYSAWTSGLRSDRATPQVSAYRASWTGVILVIPVAFPYRYQPPPIMIPGNVVRPRCHLAREISGHPALMGTKKHEG